MWTWLTTQLGSAVGALGGSAGQAIATETGDEPWLELPDLPDASDLVPDVNLDVLPDVRLPSARELAGAAVVTAAAVGLVAVAVKRARR